MATGGAEEKEGGGPKPDPKHNILMICTSTSTSSWGAQTGLWLEELAVPYYLFKEVGFEIVISSINGTIALDPASASPEGVSVPEHAAYVERFLADEIAQAKFAAAPQISSLHTEPVFDTFACVFLCGGHGCVNDFPNSSALCAAVEKAWASGSCVAAVCHGPLGLINCLLPNGKHLLSGKFMAGFSNEEETILGLIDVLPCTTENELDKLDAVCVPAQPWKPNAVVDGRLVTGQNPQSSLEVALRVLDVCRSLGDVYSPPGNVNKPWGK